MTLASVGLFFSIQWYASRLSASKDARSSPTWKSFLTPRHQDTPTANKTATPVKTHRPADTEVATLLSLSRDLRMVVTMYAASVQPPAKISGRKGSRNRSGDGHSQARTGSR